jgi:tRNA/tmRNA/rRNA uracil-C5-methylase (TrmA/RlmC/RlmD family)
MIAVVSAPIFRGTQWLSRGDGSRKRATAPAKGFFQTNPAHVPKMLAAARDWSWEAAGDGPASP